VEGEGEDEEVEEEDDEGDDEEGVVMGVVAKSDVLGVPEVAETGPDEEFAKEGAATAVVGSTRAPTPQAMSDPSGWVVLVGSVVCPVEDAIANRPVHVLLDASGEEN